MTTDQDNEPIFNIQIKRPCAATKRVASNLTADQAHLVLQATRRSLLPGERLFVEAVIERRL